MTEVNKRTRMTDNDDMVVPPSPANKTVSFAATHEIAPSPPDTTSTSATSPLATAASSSSGPTLTEEEEQQPLASSSSLSSSPSPSTSSHTRPPAIKRRRSSLKQGIQMPSLPPKQHYQHSDPLLRRLRLKDQHGQPVNLQQEFRDTNIVLFIFG